MLNLANGHNDSERKYNKINPYKTIQVCKKGTKVQTFKLHVPFWHIPRIDERMLLAIPCIRHLCPFSMNPNPAKSQDQPQVERQAAPPPLMLGRTRAMSFAMGSNQGSNIKISCSPTPPKPDYNGEEWLVHGIVGKDVDIFDIPRYSITCYSLAAGTLLNAELNPLCSDTK